MFKVGGELTGTLVVLLVLNDGPDFRAVRVLTRHGCTEKEAREMGQIFINENPEIVRLDIRLRWSTEKMLGFVDPLDKETKQAIA